MHSSHLTLIKHALLPVVFAMLCTVQVLAAQIVTFGDDSASTGWIDLGVRDLTNKTERAVFTLTDETPNGEVIFNLTIQCPYLVRRDADEIAVNGGQDDFIDSRGWPAASNDEWIEFKLNISGPGAADLSSLSLKELGLSFTGNDMIEFTDGIGGSVLRYIDVADSISSYGTGERLDGLDPLALANVGGVGDGSWALRLTARAFGEVDVFAITSFRVKTLQFEYEITVPDPVHLLPADGLLLHLDAYSLIGSTDGLPLSGAWQDLSGGGHDADSSERPIYLADGGGGYPAVSFDGIDDYLEVPLSLGTEASVFVVFSNERSPLQASYRDMLLATPGAGAQLQLSSSKNTVRVPDYPAFSASTGAGLASTLWVDGLDLTGLTGEIFGGRYYIGSAIYSSMPAATSLLIGASDALGSDAGENNIREIIVYDNALSDIERLEVEAYLAEKYRIGVRRYSLEHPVEAYPHIPGSQQFGTQYSFGESGIRGLDYVHAILRQGSRVAKFRLSNRYDNIDGFTSDPNIDSLIELVRDQPEIKQILDMPLTDYLFWVSSFSVPDWSNNLDATGLIPAKRDLIYDEVYDLCVYLLETYSGTGKTFYIGNWEGDWKFAGPNDGDTTQVPANRIQGMIDWANIRQQAVDDAKADATYSDVNLWYYLEANRMDWTRDGLPCVVNSVLPAMPKLDLLSFSSYSLHKTGGLTESLESMHSDLDILQAAIDAKTGSSISGSRLIIGEYGYIYSSANFSDLEEFAWEHLLALRNFLSWQGGTLRFILQWQFFNQEEVSPGVSKEMCQIDNQNSVLPLYNLHENFYRRMREWVGDYYTANGTLPTARAYSDEAVLQLDRTLLQEFVPNVVPWPDEFEFSTGGFYIPETVSGLNQQVVGAIYDRYGREMLLEGFDWVLTPKQQGVAIDSSGIVSIQGNASPEEYFVSASTTAFEDFTANVAFHAQLPVASIYDRLEDFSKVSSLHSDLSNLTISSGNAELRFEGDDARAARTGSSDAKAVTWHVPGLNRFHAKIYHYNGDALGTKLEAETSSDGVTWVPLALRIDPPTVTADSWSRSWVAPLNPLPVATNYVRILLIQPTQIWNPQIGEVILFGSATGYDFWKEQAFPDPGDQSNDSISGPNADPTASGVSNLYRYFTDLPIGNQAVLPKVEDSEGQIYYTLPYDPAKLDARAVVKGSLDLQNWDYTLFDSDIDTPVLQDGWLLLNADDLPASDSKFFKLELSL
jgi:hypothetical protein